MAVLCGPTQKANSVLFERKVVARRRDVDLPVLDRLAVGGRDCRQGSGATEDFGKGARGSGRQVQDDEECCRHLGLETCGDRLQGLYTSG